MAITEAQRAERHKYIGASDMAAVLGMSRWSTPVRVWSEKVGLVIKEDISEKIFVQVGQALEPLAIKMFEEASELIVFPDDRTLVHPRISFIATHLDGIVQVGDVPRSTYVPLEAKTCTAFKRKEWDDDEIPHEYLIQLQTQIAVTGAPYGYIAVIIGNEKFVWMKVERDDELIKIIEQRATEFWTEFVIPKVMPKHVMAADNKYIGKIFPEAIPGVGVPFSDDMIRIVETRQALLEDKKALSTQIDQCDADIKVAMGEAEYADASPYKVTWKNQDRKAYEVAASSFRVLRVSGGK